MPARYGAGGRYFFRLALESRGPNPALVIRFAPWSTSGVFPDWASAESRVLVPNATGLGLEYADEDGSSISWVPQWTDAQRLPTRIRISLRTPAGDWPYLTIPMRRLPAADNSRGGFSLGPE
jgi:general secretion pathway protein J